ncbi:MAG: RNB domain-containing ribonuclease, partial [bacterium]
MIDELDRKGIINSDDRGRIQYVVQKELKPASGKNKILPNKIIGTLTVNRRGFGFVKVEGFEEDVFIPEKFMSTALHGDTVAIALFARPVRKGRKEDGKLEGEVTEVIERKTTTVVGRLEESRNFYFVVSDDQRFSRDIYVSKEDAKQAKHGDKVVVKLLPWENPAKNPEGIIVEVLGAASDVRVSVMGVARSLGLPMSFPADVEKESESSSETISPEELRTRLDLRATTCVTIDPFDAKDFDDAVSFEPMGNGNFRLGVHIA